MKNEISLNKLKKRVFGAVEPVFEKYKDGSFASEIKTYYLTSNINGELSVVLRTELGNQPKIARITESMFLEKFTPKIWERLFAKAGIFYSKYKFFDRGSVVNEKKQTRLDGTV